MRISKKKLLNLLLVALASFLSFENCLAGGLTGGSFFIIYFYGKDLVIGSDSRISGTNYSADDHCKLMRLSDRLIFFGIGVTNKTGEPRYSSDDIARAVYKSTETTAEIIDMADRWAVMVEGVLGQAAESNSEELIKHNKKEGSIVNGIFNAVLKTGKISVCKAQIRLDPTQPRITFQKSIECPSDDRKGDMVKFGAEEVSNEFIENRTERAHEANEILKKTPATGVAHAARYVEELVKFVIKQSGDSTIGGHASVIILDHKDGLRWFRPGFCSEK